MGGHVGEARVGLAVYDDRGAHAVFQLADLGDEALALADCFGGAEGGVDDADGGCGWVVVLCGVRVVVGVAMRLRG